MVFVWRKSEPREERSCCQHLPGGCELHSAVACLPGVAVDGQLPTTLSALSAWQGAASCKLRRTKACAC